MANDPNTIMTTIYMPPDLYQIIKSRAFQTGQTKSQVMVELMERGVLARQSDCKFEDRHLTLAEAGEERDRLHVQHRKARIDELVKEIDAEFDERWERVLDAVKSVYD